MRYRILGTTQAFRDDGTTVPVGGARLRALLAVLALRPERTVPVAVLIDEVWGADPPADAAGALQALVGRLRRALGQDAVVSVEGGYRLAAAADQVDLFRFDRLAADGARALADGNPAKAVDVLDDALALWQGPALADLPDRQAEAARWDSRHLDARRTRFAALLALGRTGTVLPELAALCDAHPLDEPLQAQRLRALRDAGRVAEALVGYEQVRLTLADQLGTDPGPELRALHAELLSPTEPEPEPEPAAEPETRPGLRPAPAPETAPGPATAARAAGNLRARITSFVGRGCDIDAIRTDLTRFRLVTLLGPGGAGKTRLSQEAAEALSGTAAAPDGVWFAELAPVKDPSAVPEAVVGALGARETVLHGAGAEELRAVSDRHGEDPLVRLVEHCAERRMLLILDNCEHVVGAAAELAQTLLTRCPGLTVLATSREPLGVPGELLYPVEPLPEPYAQLLFGQRGAAVRPGFSPDLDPEAVAEICRRLDGLPLAIELAAARLRMLTPRQIADRLDDRFRLLTSGARTALPRQQTLRAVVDWSWDLLDGSERTVLAWLSVFRGGCDLAAAEAVCGPETLDLLASLVDKSLVVAVPQDNGAGMRYRLLETVAEYAGDRLDESGERTEAERAHLTHYRELARTTDPLLRGRGQRAALARLEGDYENLRTALRRAIDAGDEQEAISLVLSLSWFWQMRDLNADARTWVLATCELGPDPFAGPVRPAPPLLQRCTDVPPPLSGELLEEARRQVHLYRLVHMDLETDSWQSEQGRARLNAIIDTYRADLPQACRPPGNVWYFAVLMSGRPDRLQDLTELTVRTCRELGYEWELALVLQLRANILANRSEWAQDAVGDADEAIELFTRIGDEWGVAEGLSVRGEAHEKLGRFAEATADYLRAREVAEAMGAHSQATILQVRLGQVLIAQGEGQRGEQLLRETLEVSRRSTNEARPAARMLLVVHLGETGRTVEAREQLALLRIDARTHGAPFVQGMIAGMEAMIDVVDRRTGSALEHAAHALSFGDDPLTAMVMPHLRALHLLIAARALVQRGDRGSAVLAAHLVGASDAALPDAHVRSASERHWRAEAEAEARALLDEAAYGAAYAEGGGLTVEEAAALLHAQVSFSG